MSVVFRGRLADRLQKVLFLSGWFTPQAAQTTVTHALGKFQQQ